MPRFNFRLEKLLGFRRTTEKSAKDRYLQCRARVLEAEQALRVMERERVLRQGGTPTSLRDRLVLNTFLARMEDDERAQASVIAVLMQEERDSQIEWLGSKQDAEGIDKLRDKAQADWSLEEARREQRELDEWVVTRKAS